MINRRELLAATAATAGSACLLESASTGSAAPSAGKIIDTNVSLFQWPFRRLPLDTTESLLKKYRSLGISQAWAGSFEALLHRDITSVNQRLAQECARHQELTAIGSVNPELPDWESDLQRCLKEHHMLALRVHPNYHGYTLDDPRFARLLGLATSAKRLVQIAVAMEDVRTQHPLVRVPDVDPSPLVGLMQRIPGAKVQLLNYRPRGSLLQKLARLPGIYFDTARVDSTDGVPQLMKAAPGRVMLGTHAPFLLPEAALIRLHEAAQLSKESLSAVLSGNAER